MKKLDHIYVAWVLPKMFLEEHIYRHFEHEGVIDGNHAHAWFAVPAWLTTARDGRVHYVVGDEEQRLQELGEPAKSCGQEVFGFVEGTGEEEGGGVGN